MARRLVGITLDNLADLPEQSRGCTFWERDRSAGRASPQLEAAQIKEAWVSAVLLEWGSCGKIIYVDGEPAGHVLFAPPALVPRAPAFPTSPVGSDAVLLMTAQVRPEFAGQGLGRVLVQTAARDVVKRGIRAIEAFGAAGQPADCLLPVDLLLAVGFKTVRAHPRTPRLRLDLRTALRWKEDVESAIERLLASITNPSPAFHRVRQE